MPHFQFARRLLRGSKPETVIPSSSSFWCCDASSEAMAPPPPPPPSSAAILFVSLHQRPGLISLADAQQIPELVYHSVSTLPEPAAAPAEEKTAHHRESFERLLDRAQAAVEELAPTADPLASLFCTCFCATCSC
jgi:hypothetical protein